jgi:integrase
MEISDRLRESNQRLKALNIRITIERNGSKLSLRASLPPRQGEGKHTQQRIPLSISATEDGLKQAESEAHTVRRDLDAGRFNWGKYLKAEVVVEAPKLIRDWLTAFETDYFSRREKNQKSLTTWHGDYFQVFKRLPENKPLTSEIIRRLILRTAPDTKNRKRYCIILGSLARFAGVEVDTRSLSGKYSPKKVSPRDIPDDAEITKWYCKLINPAWKWVFGIIATYGLRNHEVFRLDLDQLRGGSRILHVLDGKTGARRVWACYPEWFDLFNLGNVILPEANLKRTNPELGNNVTHYFARHKLPFSAYDLRHAWAIRTLEFGLDISLAAQQMGHSLTVHSETYHHWISDRHHQHAYDLLMERRDRPKPPPLSD